LAGESSLPPPHALRASMAAKAAIRGSFIMGHPWLKNYTK
jgi:hypothetical protein